MVKLVAILACLVLSASAADAGGYRPPRTTYGHPDLQGTWLNDTMTNLQRRDRFKAVVASPYEAAAYERGGHDRYDKGVSAADPNAPAPEAGKVEDESAQWSRRPTGLARINGEIRASQIVVPADGRLPFTPQSRAASEKALKDEETYDDPEGRPFDERCLLGGGGGVAAPMINHEPVRIVQTRDHVVLFGEQNHEARIVRLDGRRLPGAVATWMGDSVGHWEGDTLVVETRNLAVADRWRWNAGDWIPLSPATHIVERFTRVGPRDIVYSYEIVDPTLYTGPWKGEAPLHATDAPIFEYACHEGNYALRNILAGARAQERQAVAKGAP